MGQTRLFVYLDEYKMYSISSQIFEGLTEYALRHSDREVQNTEEQKGPIASGRVLANIVGERIGATEKRFLHDYGYTLFEDHLISNDRVLVVRGEKLDELNNRIQDYPFIKVTGRALFNDIDRLTRTVSDFNAVGEALAYVSNFQVFAALTHELNEKLKTAKGPEKAALREQLNSLTPTAMAKANQLYQDPTFLEKLAYMLDFGYRDEFEVQIAMPGHAGDLLFSAPLTRAHFTEKEEMVARKYGRKTEVEFTLFGIVTQSGRPKAEVDINELGTNEDVFRSVLSESERDPVGQYEPDPGAVKQAIRTLVHHLSNVEESFTGRTQNEVIIDPIAVYRAL